MLRVRIRTPAQDCRLSRIHHGAIIKHQTIFKGKEGVKAVINIKTPSNENIEVVDEHKCELALSMLAGGAIITSAEVSEGEILWDMVCRDNDVFRKVIKNLEKLRVDYDIIYKIGFNEKSELDKITYNEYLILKLAFERGFFESPKKIRLEDLAKTLEISKSTASETLRRAIKKVVTKYFEQ
jgi:predicted DNA binding protein